MSFNKLPKQVSVQSSTPIEKDGPQKRPYQSPVLHHFGSLSELTTGGGGQCIDGAGVSGATGCHTAACHILCCP